MNSEKINILTSILGDCVLSKRSSELNFLCPFPDCSKDGKKKLAINRETFQWHCWRCGKSGKKPDYLISRFGSSEHKIRWFETTKSIDFSILDKFVSENKQNEIQQDDKIILPKEFISLVGNESLLSLRARNYLLSRGLSKEEIFKYRIGFCPSGKYRDRIVFPSFDSSGRVNYFVSRTYADSSIKYDNPDTSKKKMIFNELMIDFSKPVVLVEGIFDAINAGFNAIPLLGSTLKDDDLLLERVVKYHTMVYMALDPDAKKKEKQIMSLFHSFGIKTRKIKILPFKDVGAMTKDEFQRRKANSFVASDESLMVESLLGV